MSSQRADFKLTQLTIYCLKVKLLEVKSINTDTFITITAYSSLKKTEKNMNTFTPLRFYWRCRAPPSSVVKNAGLRREEKAEILRLWSAENSVRHINKYEVFQGF